MTVRVCHALQEDSTTYTLKCNISIDVNHLAEGIKLALKDDREKNSASLGRPVMYIGESRITKCAPQTLSYTPKLQLCGCVWATWAICFPLK